MDDNKDLMAKLLMGQGHPFGSMAPPTNPIADLLMAPPRNPARMPAGVENFAMDATVNPLWDAGKAVGALVSGGGLGAPEIGPGIMGAMGAISPGARGLRALKAIDADLARALKSTPDWHPMDAAIRSIDDLKKMGFPPEAIPLVQERHAAQKAHKAEVGAVDKQLKTLLKGTGIEPMDVAMRGPEGMRQLSHLIPAEKFDQVLSLAARRQKLTD